MSIGLGINIQKKREQLAGPLREAIVDGKHPGLLLDFDDEYYLANGGKKSLDEVINFTRAGNATMVDSDGLIKWAPHNLLSYSEDFSNAAWSKTDVTVSSNEVTFTSTSAELRQDFSLNPNVYTLKFDIWSDSSSGDTVRVVGAVSGATNPSQDIVLSSSRTTVSLQIDATGGTSFVAVRFVSDGSDTPVFYLENVHLYRSDLGGMAPVPAGERSFPSASTYVPTTSSARYLPRVGHHVYNGSAWVNEGVLAESEARTNLLTYSNFSARWSATRATLTTGALLSPDGQVNGASVKTNTVNDSHYVSDTLAVTAGFRYTASVFAKAGGKKWFTIYNGSGNTFFDLDDGVVGSVAASNNTTAEIQNAGNGWFRCLISFDAPSASYLFAVGPALADTDNTYIGDNVSEEIYLYGAQLEAAPTPSSYIPTAGSTVTRAAETFTIPAANLPWPTETYGPELVTNGTFDADTSGWTAVDSAVLSVSSNALRVTTPAGGAASATQTITTVVGSLYEFRFTIVSRTAGRWIVEAAPGYDSFQQTAIGEQVVYFVASSTTTTIKLDIGPFSRDAGEYVEFDNISVRELTRYPVSIQTQGRMTYADTGSSTDAGFVFWQLDTDNRIIQRLTTAGGAVGSVYFTQSYEGTVDSVISASYTPGILVPFNIASRHGMTFINGAVDGVALTEDTTPTNLPDLSATDLSLAYDYMGTVERFRVWGVDLGDGGIELASAPSLEPSLSLTFDSSESSYIVDDWSA
jgi:hypothetical protein